MSAPAPKRAKPVDRRQLLLDASRRLFLTKPYDQVTTTEIVRTAGVAYGLLAHHFGNKRGLYLATLRAAARDLQLQRDTPPDGDNPSERFRRALDRHIAYVKDNAEAYLAVVHGSLGTDPDVRTVIDDLQSIGARLILDGVGAAHPASPRLRVAVAGWIGTLNAMLQDWLTHDDLDRDDIVDLAMDALPAELTLALRP